MVQEVESVVWYKKYVQEVESGMVQEVVSGMVQEVVSGMVQEIVSGMVPTKLNQVWYMKLQDTRSCIRYGTRS